MVFTRDFLFIIPTANKIVNYLQLCGICKYPARNGQEPRHAIGRLPRQAPFVFLQFQDRGDLVPSFRHSGDEPLFVFVRIAFLRFVFFFFALVIDADENTGDQGDRDDTVDADRDRDQPSRRRDRRHIAEPDGRDQHKGVPEPVAEGLDRRLENRQQDRRPDHRDHQPGEDLRRVGSHDNAPEQASGHHVFQVRVDPGDALHQEQETVDHDLRLDRTADLGHQFREQNQIDDDHEHAAHDRAHVAPVPADRSDVFGDHRRRADRHKDHRQVA